MGDVLKADEVLVEEQRHDAVVAHDLGPDGAGPTSSKAMSINSSGGNLIRFEVLSFLSLKIYFPVKIRKILRVAVTWRNRTRIVRRG